MLRHASAGPLDGLDRDVLDEPSHGQPHAAVAIDVCKPRRGTSRRTSGRWGDGYPGIEHAPSLPGRGVSRPFGRSGRRIPSRARSRAAPGPRRRRRVTAQPSSITVIGAETSQSSVRLASSPTRIHAGAHVARIITLPQSRRRPGSIGTTDPVEDDPTLVEARCTRTSGPKPGGAWPQYANATRKSHARLDMAESRSTIARDRAALRPRLDTRRERHPPSHISSAATSFSYADERT